MSSSNHTGVEIVHPSEIDAGRTDHWRALAKAHAFAASPLIDPAFARLVGERRADARVAVFRSGGEDVGYFPFHYRPGGFGRGVGAPFSDLQAVVCAGDAQVSAADLPGRLGLNAFRFRAFAGSAGDPATAALEAGPYHAIVLEDGAEAYLEARRAEHAKSFKNFRRLERRAESECGAIELIAPDRDRAHLDLLIAWKRAQLQKSGYLDLFANPRLADFVQRAFEARDPDCEGLLMMLTIGGAPVAGHFGVRGPRGYHPWIAAFDPDFAGYSPGNLFMLRAIEAMPGLGLSEYHLATSHDHYKKNYVGRALTVQSGVARAQAPSLSGAAARAWRGVEHAAWHRAAHGAQRLRRRLDQIAEVELDPFRRAGALADAVRTQTFRRSKGAQPDA